MKKYIMIFTLLIISSCGMFNKDVTKKDLTTTTVDILPIQLNQFVNSNNYTIRITDELGNIANIIYNDNGKYLIEDRDRRYYYETKDGVIYQYYAVNESTELAWYKEVVDSLVLIEAKELINLKALTSAMLEKNGDNYILKSDYHNIIKNFEYPFNKVEFSFTFHKVTSKIYLLNQANYKIEYFNFDDTFVSLPYAVDERTYFDQFLNDISKATNFSYNNVYNRYTIHQEGNLISYLTTTDAFGNESVIMEYLELLDTNEYYHYFYQDGMYHKELIPTGYLAFYDFSKLNIDMFDEISGSNWFRLKQDYFGDVCLNRDITKIGLIEFSFNKHGNLIINMVSKNDDAKITFHVYGFNFSPVALPELINNN